MYCIYVIQNKLNSKIYVGQTCSLKTRISRHKYEAFTKNNDKPLYRSIRKHGFENFEIIEIEQLMKTDLDEAEQFWISFFQSNKKDYGYNLTNGGTLHTKSIRLYPKIPPMLGKNHSIDTKEKMSNQRTGEGNGFYGKNHSEESKNKMSKNPNRKFIGEANYFSGKHFNGSENPFSKLTEEIVLEARQKHKMGSTFSELALLYNISESAISRAIRGLTWKHIHLGE